MGGLGKRALLTAVGLVAAAFVPFSAIAQTAPKEVSLHDSPLQLRGPPFEGAVARTTVRDNEVISQGTWNVFCHEARRDCFHHVE